MSTYQLSAYPKQVALRDGRTVTLRPLTASDADALQAFFMRVSADDRYFLKHDVTSPATVKSWTSNLDYDRALPIVATAGDAIIADGVLVRSRHGAYRSVAAVRIAVDPDHREQGLGTAILRELCDIAADAELEKVTAELINDVQDDALQAMEQLGFIRSATVHELVRDEQGHTHDLVIMVLPLGKWYQWWQF